MSAKVESSTLDVNRDSSPSAKSDSSQVSYTDDVISLPSRGPACHAHIIDLGVNIASIKELGSTLLQDAVATTLFQASPDTLKMFLSPTVHTFKVVFGKKDTQLVIWRKGVEVLVCFSMSSQYF